MNTKRVSIAVAVTALGLALSPAGAFGAEDQVQCGAPAKDAVYSTVAVPGQPAVSHDEYEWSRVTTVIEKQWQHWVVDKAAQPAVYETVHHPAVYETVAVPGEAPYDEQVLKTAAYDEQLLVTAASDEQVLKTAAYDEQVLKTAAYDEQVLVKAGYDEQVMMSPAVYATEYKFVSLQGRIRWDEDPNWNAQPNQSSAGWVADGESREGALVSAAVYTTVHHDAVYDTVHHDAVYTTVHHDAVFETVHHDAEYTTVHHDAVYTTVHHDGTPDTTTEVLVTPAWDEQVEVSAESAAEGHYATSWSQSSPGDGWSDTGETRSVSSDAELAWSVESPGAYWTKTGESRTVVDLPAVPESTTQVLVSEAVPAGADCVDDTDLITSGGGEFHQPAAPAPAVPAAAAPAAAVAASAVPAAAAAPAKAAPTVNAAPRQLAFTGVDPALGWIGLGLFVAGLGLSAAYRKTARQD